MEVVTGTHCYDPHLNLYCHWSERLAGQEPAIAHETSAAVQTEKSSAVDALYHHGVQPFCLVQGC